MHTLILGFDAFDPKTFERLSGLGKLPHLTEWADRGGYARFEVANPPQSQVSWTSIATGLNPGEHGIFDFVHRNPLTYAPYLSLLPTKDILGGTQFVPPHTATTLFEQAAHQGYPATALWWPATFPARLDLPVRTIPGLGTPDIHGRMGVGTLFCSDPASMEPTRKTPVLLLEQVGPRRYTGTLPGPARKTRRGGKESALPLTLELSKGEPCTLRLGKALAQLHLGKWSPVIEVEFKLGLLVKVHAVTQVMLTRVEPDVRLYVLPLQLHPLHCPWRYGSPGSFVKQIWQRYGPFLTLGMPQDTTGLEDGCITDEQFLSLCDSILQLRRRILMDQLGHFGEGVLAVVFDSLDRLQHVFSRERPQIVEKWYERLDGLVGAVLRRLTDLGREKARVVMVSDHGIAPYDYKVHPNSWLLEHGYLVKKADTGPDDLDEVDWPHSKAYAVGLNSLYINKAGREGQGSVPANECEGLVKRLQNDLQHWRGEDSMPVIQRVWSNEEVFVGPLALHGPDMVVGYAPGYRASAETGLGAWKTPAIERNNDHWSSDHCVDYRAVPGVLFANFDLSSWPHPSYRDFPGLTIGVTPVLRDAAPPPELGDEDSAAMEERLRSLGYL